MLQLTPVPRTPVPRAVRPPLDGRKVMVRFVGVIARVPRYLKLGWGLMNDPVLPRRGKAALVGALGYAVSPIDPLPGIIPVIGQLDDLAVLLLGVRVALNAVPAEVGDRHLAASGLTRDALERDLVTLRATFIWVAGKGALVAGRAGKALLRFALSKINRR